MYGIILLWSTLILFLNTLKIEHTTEYSDFVPCSIFNVLVKLLYILKYGLDLLSEQLRKYLCAFLATNFNI